MFILSGENIFAGRLKTILKFLKIDGFGERVESAMSSNDFQVRVPIPVSFSMLVLL